MTLGMTNVLASRWKRAKQMGASKAEQITREGQSIAEISIDAEHLDYHNGTSGRVELQLNFARQTIALWLEIVWNARVKEAGTFAFPLSCMHFPMLIRPSPRSSDLSLAHLPFPFLIRSFPRSFTYLLAHQIFFSLISSFPHSYRSFPRSFALPLAHQIFPLPIRFS